MYINNEPKILQINQGSVLKYILIILTITGLILGLVNLQFGYKNPSIYINLSLSLMSLIGLYLNRKGKTKTIVLMILLTALAIVTTNMVISQGLKDPGLIAFPIMLIVGCLFLGSSSVLFLSITMIIVINIVGISEINGFFKVAKPTSIASLMIYNVLLILSGLATFFIIKNNEIQNKTIEAQNKDLEKQTRQKDLLIKEVFHRIKNNLFLINAFLTLNIDKITSEEDKKIFKACINQLNTMALIHEKIYITDSSEHIDFQTYLKELISQYQGDDFFIKNNINISINDFKLTLLARDAFSLGLIINELITNSYKHAFNDTQEGKIHINITAKDQKVCTVEYRDSGPGFDITTVDSNSLGIMIIDALTEKLQGIAEYNSDKGFRFYLTFSIFPINTHADSNGKSTNMTLM